MLTVHENGRVEIGKEAELAQTEVKIKIFGRNELGIVPNEVFGKKILVYHDAGVLKGVGGVHKLVDGYMVGWEELFAGDMAVFVYSKALTADNNDTEVSFEVVELFLKTIGK